MSGPAGGCFARRPFLSFGGRARGFSAVRRPNPQAFFKATKTPGRQAGAADAAGGPVFCIFRESLIDPVIHADGIFLRPAASQRPRNSAAIPSASFLAGGKNLPVIAKTS